ncbi:MAG TPA: ATP-binding SpoIIE family protein phosphatase [Verrucomicrobiae bacterium]|nr:ATP-binding SpoIIE family protein phosphatase [Verrucomicrobiae bacterium]
MAAKLILDYSQQSLPVRDPGHPGEARRTATRLVGEIGFDETDTSNVAIIVTELATNLLKHATGGEILLRPIAHGAALGVELIALDRGPGIANLTQCFRDGYSSAGSSGNGLGAIARLAGDFDIYSMPGKGTAVLARVWPRCHTMENSHGIELGIVSLPKPGEEVCGDGWQCELLADKSLCFVADGLGHGSNAAVAAHEAVDVLTEYRGKTPAEIVERAHDALRSTRGAALAVAQIDHPQETVRFCGVGNIAGAIVAGGRTRQMVSLNGTAGLEVRKITEFSYPWSSESTLIMHSDGLMTRWDLQLYPALAQRHPSLIAAVLYRDFNRNRDDVTVLVAKAANSVAGRNMPWLTQ